MTKKIKIKSILIPKANTFRFDIPVKYRYKKRRKKIMNENMEKLSNMRVLTIAEAAEYACVSRATVEIWIVNKLLPYEEFPSRGTGTQRFMRIRLDDLKNFLDQHYHKWQQSDKVKNVEELLLLPRNN